MRMRKKKYLSDRLDAVKDILFAPKSDDRNFNNYKENAEYIDLDSWFHRKAPLYLEIGCGKGKFSVEYAKSHKDINLLAVEKDANVIVAACEAAKEAGLDNLKFIQGSAEYLERYLKEGSVERLFLNFSCPYPKNTYASHRLTHKGFLERYKRLMSKGAEIHQKTDNMHFFEFSIEQFSQNGFAIKNLTFDLHNSGFEGNIVTEYEQKFLDLGQPIYRLEAFLPEK